MSWSTAIVIIVALSALVSIVDKYLKVRRRGHGLPDARAANDESLRLRDEVKQLKERLAVLERITIEKENSLSREIEDLRGR